MKSNLRNWKSAKAFRDFGIAFGIAIFIFILAFFYNGLERLNEFFQKHEGWQLDKLFILFIALSFAFIVFSILRWKELSHEITEHKRAEEQIKFNEIRLQSFYNISQCKSKELGDLLDYILNEAIHLTGSKIGWFGFYHEENKTLTVSNWSKEVMKECKITEKKLVFPIENAGIWAEGIRRRMPFIVNDYQAPDLPKKDYPAGHSEIFRFLTIPLLLEDMIVGAVAVANKEKDYDETDILQLTLLMDSVLKIVEQRRAEEALQKSEEEAKWLAQENAVVAEIGQIISSTLNIDNIYESFAEEVRKLIPFDRIAINCINLRDNTITTNYVAGIDVIDRFKGNVIPLVGTLSEEIIHTRASKLIQKDDLKNIIERFPMLSPFVQAGIQSSMAIPLISKDEVFGILQIQSTKPNAYSERELSLAERVGNQIAGAIANAQLFAEHRQSEEALRISEERFKELYDNAPIGYQEFDTEGRITRVNRTELEMLGYTEEEMLDRHIWDFIVETQCLEVLKERLESELPPGHALERTFRRKDGTTFPVLIQERFLRDDEGRMIGIRSTIQDITELKRAEERMNTLQEQLRQSQKMEAIGRLAGGIAHDFNNLLTVIKGYSQLSLRELKKGDPLKDNIEEIQKASQRATDMTRQLLVFSRRQILEFKVLDLNTTLQDLDKMLHRLIGEDIELFYRLSDSLGKVKTDPGQIEQVILNLAVNARDAMPSGGKLTIETANVVLDELYARTHADVKPGPYVMLSITDTGCGMSQEVKEHIFEPFFTTKEKGKGTGLGLSTVYGIIKQSEGDIWFYSEKGLGTTFKIYLPRVDEILMGEKEKVAVKFPFGGETILVVEDDLSVQGLAVRVLQRQGYTVLEASNGDEALRVAQEHAGKNIHLLLTDVVMPGMSGSELADRLRSSHREIRVLYMSGYTDNSIVQHGVLSPGIYYLQKPFAPETLAQKVRELLDRR